MADPSVDAISREIYIQPGESHLTRESSIMRTVLGSCVGVTFWNRRQGVGALCHPMLPCCPARPSAKPDGMVATRYVDFAIRDLAVQLDLLGARRQETEVKLFGGADVLATVDGSGRPTVGKLNGEMALRILREEGFAVTASRLGGISGLHIEFNTATGEVLLRRLSCRPEALPRAE